VFCPQCGTTRHGRRRQREIELDVAHHVRAQRVRADVAEAFGIRGTLRCNDDAVRERLPEERGKAPVPADRARRDARACQHQRHAAPAAFVVQIRPQFCFEDDRDTRPHASEESPHRSRQVVGHITHVREACKQGTRALCPGRCHGRHDERYFGVPLTQRAYEGCRGLYLADRDSVHPEAGTCEDSRAKSEAFAEVAPVAVIAKTPQQHRDADERREQIDHAQIQQAHRREAFPKQCQPGTCTPAASCVTADTPSR